MGKARATKTVREAARVALKDGPLPLKEIAEKISEQGVKLKGKTPMATIRKTLDRDEMFDRPKPGVYALSAKANEPEPELKSADEFAPDLQEAAAGADAEAKKRQASKPQKPKPKSSGDKTRQAAKV